MDWDRFFRGIIRVFAYAIAGWIVVQVSRTDVLGVILGILVMSFYDEHTWTRKHIAEEMQRIHDRLDAMER